jgi:hypothetical protein
MSPLGHHINYYLLNETIDFCKAFAFQVAGCDAVSSCLFECRKPVRGYSLSGV